MWTEIAAAMLLASGNGGMQVDVGRFNMSAMPQLQLSKRELPTPAMVAEVETMFRDGSCSMPSQSARRFDVDVPFAVLVEPDGSAHRAVIGEVGCRKLETLVGLIVEQLAREGSLGRSAGTKAKWFASKINFNLK
jgi:hypothetical protein